MRQAGRSWGVLVVALAAAFASCAGCVDGPGSAEGAAAAGRDLPPREAGRDPRDPRNRQGGKSADRDAVAEQIVQAMIERYRDAESYSDRGYVLLAYSEGGEPTEDRAPMELRFSGPNRLDLASYAARIRCDGQRLVATIDDPGTENLEGQALLRTAPPRRPRLEDLYGDPLLAHFATAGMGGPSPQVELLYSDTPLAGLLDPETRLLLEAPAEVEGHLCDRVVIADASDRFVLWIDRQQRLLRRVELPWNPPPDLLDEMPREARLSIELTGATFEEPELPAGIGELPPETVWVSQLVMPPPPLATELFGRRAEPFTLASHDQRVRVTEAGSDRAATVLLWIALHDASRAAAVQLQRVADRLSATVAGQTRFLIVMAEPAAAPGGTGRMLRSWGVGLDWTDDEEAVGRDAFGIREAPTLCVLGSDGTVHWFRPRVSGEMADGLPAVLLAVLAGEEVGAELRTQHAQDRERFGRLLEAARVVTE